MLRMRQWDSLISYNMPTHTLHMQKLENIQTVHDVIALLSIDTTGGSQVLWGDLLGGVQVVVPLPRSILLEPDLRLVGLEAAGMYPAKAHEIPCATQVLRFLW